MNFDDENVSMPVAHEVGMPLDSLSIDELVQRIEMLNAEILRLRDSIEIKSKTRTAADEVFKI